MPAHVDLAGRAAAMTAAGTPFVWATVVRAHRPTSAKAGDSALVLADGQIDGFVGGDCAESTVRAQALEVLSTGQTRLLRITPTDEGQSRDEDGTVTVHNACLSGGTLEIFLEPSVPLPVVAVFGTAPIAMALLRADRLFGLQVRAMASPDEPLAAGAVALVVASHGNDEAAVLTAGLRAGIDYVGLVASRVRGPAVLDSLDVDDAQRKAVRTPAGLDIGAHSAPEVALSILAEIIAARSKMTYVVSAELSAEPAGSTVNVIDPVCGMTVAAVAASPHAETPSGTVYFCGTGCRTAYLDNPGGYGAQVPA
jgi:xanthine dehydrogenase accessory factor